MHLYTSFGLEQFADTYGKGAYGNCPYSTTGSTSTCTADSGNSGLVNTGIAVGLVVGAACLVLVIAILVRFWRRPGKVAEEVVIDQTDDTQRDDEGRPRSDI